jgi:hypothetical protein
MSDYDGLTNFEREMLASVRSIRRSARVLSAVAIFMAAAVVVFVLIVK